jgi:hypothetical protein
VEGDKPMSTITLFGRDAETLDAVIILQTALRECDDPAGRLLLWGAICHTLKQWRDYQTGKS